MIKIELSKQLNPDGHTPRLEMELAIPENTRLGVLGPSGAGKTTFLRILAGLTNPDSGKIIIGSETWFDSERNINRPPQKRGIGFVFQDYALFPNMSARENLEFAFPGAVDQAQLTRIMQMLDIEAIANQKPATLSGGQKQRVALGRALIQRPKLLLLDEPLSALDPSLRSKLQSFLQRVSRNFDGTVILVSHDPTEIIQLTDRVVKFENGKILDEGDSTVLLMETTESTAIKGKILKILPDKQSMIIKTALGVFKIPLPTSNGIDLSAGDTVTFQINDVAVVNPY